MDKKIGTARFPCKYPFCRNKFYKPIFNKGYKNKNFYRFPRDKAVQQVWKDFCNMNDGVKADRFYLCEEHFDPKDFANHVRNKLNLGAVPKKVPDASKECSNQVDYSFLSENDPELSIDPQFNRITMLNIHQMVSSRLLKLRDMLEEETELVQKLFALFKSGKFDYIAHNLNYVSNEFLESQLEYAQLTVKKWTEDDHFLALSFYCRNEKLYKYLSAFFNLPTVKTLKHILNSVPVKTAGLNTQLIDRIKPTVAKMNLGNRTCVLLMTEMILTRGIHYDESQQYICGYEDLGHLGRSLKVANRALVFTVRGLRKDWMQFVSFYFNFGPLKSVNLQNIIVKTVKSLQATGLNVAAFVCEQNNTNLSTLSLMCARIELGLYANYFTVNSKKVYVVFDAFHLLIETRKAFKKCKIVHDANLGKVAQIEHIECAYNIDQAKRMFKQLCKLKDEYFDTSSSADNDNIAAATATFSHTVAASIESFIACKNLPQEALHTAEFVEIMDMLFDSLTGSEKEPPHHKTYRCAVTSESAHLKFWLSLLNQFRRWKLINIDSLEDVTGQYTFINGWQMTVESCIQLWSELKQGGLFSYLSLDRFSLKPLENLFQSISQYGTSGETTCHQFMSGLNCVLNEQKSAWLPNDCYNLISLRTFTESDVNAASNEIHETYFDELDFEDINPLIFHEQAAYLSGYLVHKIDISDCETCRSYLLAEWVLNSSNLISHKKYSLYASDHIIRIVDRILYLLFQFLNDDSTRYNLENDFKHLYRQEFESFKFCNVHDCKENIINMCIKLGIHRFVYCFNKRVEK